MVLGRFPDLLSCIQIQTEAGRVHTGGRHIDPSVLHRRSSIPSQTYWKLPGEFPCAGAGRFRIARVMFVPLKHGPVSLHVSTTRKPCCISRERLINRTFFFQSAEDLLHHLVALIHHPTNVPHGLFFRRAPGANGFPFQRIVGPVDIKKRMRIRVLLLNASQPNEQKQSPLLVAVRGRAGFFHLSSHAVDIGTAAGIEFSSVTADLG